MYYHTPTQLKPCLKISLEDFVVKCQNDITFKTEIKALSFMINHYTKDGYFDNDFISELIEYYSEVILPEPRFNFHIDPEDGYCHLSFPYQSGERLLDIHLEDFHFTERFNLATVEDVFNLICDFQWEVQKARYDLEFKPKE